VLAARPWDVVVIDEAHHARRKGFSGDRRRPNRLLELIAGTTESKGLVHKTKCLFLLTATPMQVHPVEVWDLMKSLRIGGRWEASEDNYLNFFSEIRKPFHEIDWEFVLDMFRDSLAGGAVIDGNFRELVKNELGPVMGDNLLDIHNSLNTKNIIRQLSPRGRELLIAMVKQFTPLKRIMKRSTRGLLRRYKEKGLLEGSVPKRMTKPEWISMNAEERALYDKIEEYISDFYQKYESTKKGLGFIMTVYRRRLTSSFYAVERSLERRLEFLDGKIAGVKAEWLTEEDTEEDDLSKDLSEELDFDPSLFQEEIKYIERFLEEIRDLRGNSKWEKLHEDVVDFLNHKESLVIFTQYTDTMDYLRDRMRQVYGGQVACYSGRGGEIWNGVDWSIVGKEEIKNRFRKAEEIKILLCTEAASEGLNLQTSGVLINYDMPWNPMKAEQRIGRIDRIGGHEEVVIRNYFYSDTVEAKIYQALSSRIHWFEWVVGELQPILSSVASTIQEIAMTGRDIREEKLEEAIAGLIKKHDELSVEGLNLDDFVVEDPEDVHGQSPVTLKELERVLTQCRSLDGLWAPCSEYPNCRELTIDQDRFLITFDAELFDERPESVKPVTFGSQILDRLLEMVEPVRNCTVFQLPLVCIRTTGQNRFVVYYKIQADSFSPINTLGELESVLDGKAMDLTAAEAETAVDEAKADFVEKLAAFRKHESEIAAARRESRKLALEEEARILLSKAGYIHLARVHKSSAGSDDQLSMCPMGDVEDMINILKQKKYPYAGLLTFPQVANFRLKPEDPFYQSIKNKQEKDLKTREEKIRNQAGKVLEELAEIVRDYTCSSWETEGERGEYSGTEAAGHGKYSRAEAVFKEYSAVDEVFKEYSGAEAGATVRVDCFFSGCK
jgi:hypothetical protein